MDVEELIARQEITDVLHRYCRAVDRRDPDLLRSVYHPDATDDHGVYAGRSTDSWSSCSTTGWT